ncbi:RTA1-domain-containing protein [Thozetella sp. PMI_491]|nr:RTA1-domain-containing protein [Thozetella sp. PMI_491]
MSNNHNQTSGTPANFRCNNDNCPIKYSYYLYRIDLAANVAFLAIFSISLVAFVAVFLLTRRGFAFTMAMVLGLLCEVIGYGGRIMSWKNQFEETGFLIQICCLTMGPAFLAAGIYLCLRRIVLVFGPENSRIPPKFYTRIFIPCDVVSLILQAVGGALASTALYGASYSVDTGDNVMIAGLASQVFTLLVFLLLALDFGARTLSRHKRLGAAAVDQDPSLVAIRQSRLFRGFLIALSLSSVCIFWRCVFRVAELSRGWKGTLMARQDLFIGFEGVMITIACLGLNIFHPSLCFKQWMDNEDNFERKQELAEGQIGVIGSTDTGLAKKKTSGNSLEVE